MYKFSIVVSRNAVKYGYSVFFEFVYKSFNILNSVINHKIFFGWGKIFISFFERIPLKRVYLVRSVNVSGFKTRRTPFIDFKP